jgi:hypothetical protein
MRPALEQAPGAARRAISDSRDPCLRRALRDHLTFATCLHRAGSPAAGRAPSPSASPLTLPPGTASAATHQHLPLQVERDINSSPDRLQSPSHRPLSSADFSRSEARTEKSSPFVRCPADGMINRKRDRGQRITDTCKNTTRNRLPHSAAIQASIKRTHRSRSAHARSRS